MTWDALDKPSRRAIWVTLSCETSAIQANSRMIPVGAGSIPLSVKSLGVARVSLSREGLRRGPIGRVLILFSLVNSGRRKSRFGVAYRGQPCLIIVSTGLVSLRVRG